ncbi:hypothetical protein HHL08_19605 [Sphingobium sp. AR-3-1]|uniref:Uncharacterized protein n=1 Tax=Sphingobium psychrophilum TaxID=2728834 RepID=A0A7X9WYL6_9SPHN|nr:hypothetical protein [Sphingobium psychrophilum]NML12315.1 hypothetical protein [Sphingobium psychrophilum]
MISPEDSGIQSLPGKASVEEGLVLLDGPNGIAVTMTAYAASETGKSLLEAARLIEGKEHNDK